MTRAQSIGAQQKRFYLKLGAAAVLVLGGLLLAPAIMPPQRTAGPCVVASGPAPLPGIPEASGLAVSRHTPGMLWSRSGGSIVGLRCDF